MDRTSIIILVLCFVAMMLLWPLVNKFYPPKPLPPGATNMVGTTVAGTNRTITNSTGSTGSVASSLTSTSTAPLLAANTNIQEELLVVTNQDARYTFSSHGGGLKLVELLRYPEATSTIRQRRPETNRVATLNTFTPAPSLAILDGPAIQEDGFFKLIKTDQGARAEKTLSNGLVIVKDFQLSSNYLVNAKIRLENHSSESLNLPPQDWFVGTATPMGPRDDGTTVGVIWYNGAKTAEAGAAYFSSRGFACMPRTPPTEFRAGTSNVFWVAVHNQYFALAIMPQQPAQEVVVRHIELPRLTGEDARFVATNGPPPQGYPAFMTYPSLTLAPQQVSEREIFIYAGPKEYQTLARLADRFNNNLDLLMGFGWSGFVSKALLLGMNWLHQSLKFSYGWAIVTITLLIKLIFWPLTASSTRSSKRMQALQPQVNAIREKYKDDPMKVQRKMMELWKENKVSPMGSCLPMLLQIPVFFGFLQMIRSAIELRGAPWLWVGDLSKPDTLFLVPGMGFVPFIGIPGIGLPFNLLPLIMGATMLWQARLTPPAPGMDPTQQTIMKYLPLIFLVGLYNFSAAMTLYWTVNNLLTIAQTKLTRTSEPLPAMKPAVLTTPQKKKK